jgi:T-complex protein 1 subunit theta
MAIRIMSKFETLRICKSLNATVQTKLKIPSDDEIGFASKIYATTIGENKVVRIETALDEGDMVTIALRGTTVNFLDDIERTINNGIDM